MFLKVLLLINILGNVLSAVPPTSGQYRSDYIYNGKTDAFYKFHIESRNDNNAAYFCRLEGAQLMVVKSQDDIKQAHALFKQYPDLENYMYIGTDGEKHESKEVPLILLPQSDESRDYYDYGGVETACDVLTRGGEIESNDCTDELPFICKVEAKDAPFDRRCDVYATGYTYYEPVGSCYKVSEVRLPWNEAYGECRGEGAHLVVVNSQAENKALGEFLQQIMDEYFLAGIRAEMPGREFRTIFNETLEQAGYSKWLVGEPNNLKGKEFCGSIYGNAEYNDVDCNRRYRFICEKEVK